MSARPTRATVEHGPLVADLVDALSDDDCVAIRACRHPDCLEVTVATHGVSGVLRWVGALQAIEASVEMEDPLDLRVWPDWFMTFVSEADRHEFADWGRDQSPMPQPVRDHHLAREMARTVLPAMVMAPSRRALAATLLASVGCSTQFVPTNPPPHALMPRSPAQIEILSSGSPSRPHVDVGLIRAWGGLGGMDEFLGQLRDEGARRGCDAVVLTGSLGTCVVYSDR